jgi:predicted nucleic acid-binding protein
MPFILDTSIIVSVAFPDEDDRLAQMVLTQLLSDYAIVPARFWFEIRNALLAGERRGRLSEAQTSSFLEDLSLLPIAVDRKPNEKWVLDLARRHQLTLYDATYLELAQREIWALATDDNALIRAAQRDGVPVWPR